MSERPYSEPCRPLAALAGWVRCARTRHNTPALPVAGPSIWKPIHLGIDETGAPVRVSLIYRNALLAGEPGAGKSVGLNNVVAHAALSTDARLWLFDGKLVELGLWRSCAERFVGNDLADALQALDELQAEMDTRYDVLDADRRRKIDPTDDADPIVVVIDELAYFSATVGTKREQEQFSVRVRDLVARGRAAGIIVIAATQRPSSDIIPTSLRDLFGYRWAFRCTTDASSDIVLGHGWAARGHTAAAIAPEDKGIGLLLAEGGEPRRIKAAYLSDEQVYALADQAALHRLGQSIADHSPGQPRDTLDSVGSGQRRGTAWLFSATPSVEHDETEAREGGDEQQQAGEPDQEPIAAENADNDHGGAQDKLDNRLKAVGRALGLADAPIECHRHEDHRRATTAKPGPVSRSRP